MRQVIIYNIILPIVSLVSVATIIVLTHQTILPSPQPMVLVINDDSHELSFVNDDRDDSHDLSLSYVFFSIKSAEVIYPYSRLTPLALTWFRKVPSKNVRSSLSQKTFSVSNFVPIIDTPNLC